MVFLVNDFWKDITTITRVVDAWLAITVIRFMGDMLFLAILDLEMLLVAEMTIKGIGYSMVQ